MFTGIVETTGTVREVIPNGSNMSFWIQSPISAELKADQSVSHDGVCLTVEEIKNNCHRVTAIEETLAKTTLGNLPGGWQPGTEVNLERCLRLGDRLDGHIVQGHADATAVCVKRKEKKGSWELEFSFPKKFAGLVIEKGSVCLNGISLTAFNVKKKSFTVAVVPYTFEHTNINRVKKNSRVNIEFDTLGKYLLRSLSLSEGLPQRDRNN
ncbi:MAG: riboflavin synthase [Bacteroidota bacterium]